VPPSQPLLCYVTDGRSVAPPGPELGGRARLLEVIERAAAAGVDWIQLRENDLPTNALRELAGRAVERAGTRSRVLINDRFDVALVAGAAGVHLGAQSLPVAEVARWRRARHGPEEFLIGASCHSLYDARAAENEGADYVFFGPVFFTPSKLTYGPSQGLRRLEEVCHSVKIPVLAIGGITLECAAECVRAGAAGIAAIRLFQHGEDIANVVARLRAMV
jgi:thiamine-phosphate pyrophosphorylase